MITCPRCKYHFVPTKDVRSEDAFALFHVLRDAYARAQGYNNIYAKDELCVLFGVAIPADALDMQNPPGWAGRFCWVWESLYYRKSTLNYSKEEMAALIAGTQEAIIEAGGVIPAV